MKLNYLTMAFIVALAVVFAFNLQRFPFTVTRAVGLGIAIPSFLLFMLARIQLGRAFSLKAKATALVTTEKDAVNLCAGFREAIAPLEVYWLKVRMTIDREAEFLRLVTAPFAVKR